MTGSNTQNTGSKPHDRLETRKTGSNRGRQSHSNPGRQAPIPEDRLEIGECRGLLIFEEWSKTANLCSRPRGVRAHSKKVPCNARTSKLFLAKGTDLPRPKTQVRDFCPFLTTRKVHRLQGSSLRSPLAEPRFRTPQTLPWWDHHQRLVSSRLKHIFAMQIRNEPCHARYFAFETNLGKTQKRRQEPIHGRQLEIHT